MAIKEQPQELSVLLIEDAPGDALAIVQAILHGDEAYSFNIIRMGSLKEGLQHLKNNKPDVILLDLGLPDAKGLKAITEVCKAHPDIPVVVISGFSSIDTVHHALQKGAQEFLVKGECSGVAIRQAVYQAIARKRM